MDSPVFLFSLPRSGSTLLQRMLLGHEQIASISEGWVLLPLIYAMKKKGVVAEYSHISSQIAMRDIIANLENREVQCLFYGTGLYYLPGICQIHYFMVQCHPAGCGKWRTVPSDHSLGLCILCIWYGGYPGFQRSGGYQNAHEDKFLLVLVVSASLGLFGRPGFWIAGLPG